MKPTTLLVILFSTLVLLKAQAQNPEPKVWTLQACIDYALENNLSLKQSGVTVETNKNNLSASKWGQLPTVNGSANYSLNGGGLTINPFTNSTVSNQTFGSNSYALSSNVTLFSGLQRQNTIAQNMKGLAASKQDLLNSEQNIKLQIAQAYLNIISAKEQLSAAKLQLEGTKQQLDRTEKLVNAGASPLVNLLNLKAQLASEELSLVSLENSYDLGILQLQQLMQLPATSNFTIQSPDISKITVQEVSSTVKNIYELAEQTQPSIIASKDRVDQALYAVKTAQGGYAPSLSASGSVSTSYSELAQRQVLAGYTTSEVPVTITVPNVGTGTGIIATTQPNFTTEKISYRDQLNNNSSWRAGLSLNIPIFNGFQTRVNVQNATLQLKSAEYSEQTAKNTLRQTIEQAWLDAKLASKRYSATGKQVESLSEAFRNTETRFNAGTANSVDYNLAKTNLNKAQADLIRFKYEYLFRVKVLDFYMGKPLAF